jgi:ketosteroid isomerase-like protein
MREAFQAFARGELTVLAELLDPDVEWRAVEDPETRRGFEGATPDPAARSLNAFSRSGR